MLWSIPSPSTLEDIQVILFYLSQLSFTCLLDVVMGVVITKDDKINDDLRFVQNGFGSVPAPFDCYMALRGVRTLHVRQEASGTSALRIATHLENHDMVEKVIYPGLPSHPQYDLATEQQHGYGSMITFYIKGDREDAAVFLSKLHLFILAESLGSVESLAESPSIMTHASVPPDQREILGEKVVTFLFCCWFVQVDLL